MPKTYPSGATGAVTLPTGHGADIASYDAEDDQPFELCAFFGSNLYNPARGSGTFTLALVCAAFAAYGAAGMNPGLGAATNVGGSGTVTVATGVTGIGSLLLHNTRMSQARMRAAVALVFSLRNSADVFAWTWPVT